MSSISRLPHELLKMVFQELMPLLDQEQSDICPYDNLRYLPVPFDLCSAMAVCTLFRRLAEPFVWRRVAIVLHDPNEPEVDSGYRSARLRGPLLSQWQYIRDNNRLASHIRILTLEILGYNRDTPSSVALSMLTSVVSRMSDLRVLRLNIHSKHRETEQIYMSLVDKPLLHTVITLYRAPPEVQIPLRSTLTHLNILEWHPAYESLLRRAPCLQSLAIKGPEEEPGDVRFGVLPSFDTIPIPWGTLRKIALKWVEPWDLVLTNLSSWKKSHPNASSPLSEVTVQLTGPQMTAEHVYQVSCMGQDLRALYLCGLKVVDEGVLDMILDAFPKLEDLGLLSDYWCKPWDVNLPTLLHFFERLPRLKRLHWNYVDQEVEQDTDFDVEVSDLKEIFRQIAPMVALRCEALERITFNDESESTIEHVMRDVREDETMILTGMSLDRTSWDFWDYEHV